MKKSLGLLSGKATAKRIGVTEKTLCEWIKGGMGPARVLFGKRYYFKRETIDAWIEKCLTPVAAPRPKPQLPSAPAPAGNAVVA